MAPKRKKATSGKRTRKQSGKGVKDVFKKIHRFVKDHKIISRGLRLTPYSGVANAAAMLGYGRKRKKATSGKRLSSALLANLVGAPIAGRRRRLVLKNPIKMGRGRATGQHGAGIFGKIGGALLSNFLPF